MKGFLKFIAIFSGILLVSAFLAPILYDFLPFKFERIFNRIVMIGTLLAIVIFVRVNKETFSRLGLMWKKASPALLVTGFLAGVLTLSATSALNVFLGHANFVVPSFTAWVCNQCSFCIRISGSNFLGAT